MFEFLTPSYDACCDLADAGFPQTTAFAWVGRGPLSAPVLGPRRGLSSLRRDAVAAPTLEELLAHLPTSVACTVPHPIYRTVEREHGLRMETGATTVFGYHLVGSFDVRHRAEHSRAVEAAARLFLDLHAAGKLAAPAPAPVRIAA